MTINTQVLWMSNDNVVELQGFKSVETGQFLNGATVTITLKDADDNDVSGESWPLSLAYVTGSNGTYRATLTDAISLTEYAQYTAIVDADGGNGKRGYWRLNVMARYRNY